MGAAIVQFLQDLFNAMGWGGVVVAMAIESFNIPMPSEVIMPLAGWMLAEGDLDFVVAGIFGALGCTIGSVASYWLGALGGYPLLRRYGRYILISEQDLDRADRWLDRHGEPVIFFSRLVPVVRTFISLPAGFARLNLPQFILFTFLGSFIWCTVLAYAGHRLGENWVEVDAAMRPYEIPIAIAIAGLIVWFVYRHLRRRGPRR